MGQHKVAGRIKGFGYRDNQNMKGHKVRIYRTSDFGPGQSFKMQDGRKYLVDQSGSFRRL